MNDRDDRTNAHPHGGPAPPALQIMEAALGYNHHGIAVLPLHTVVEGVCSCGDEDCTSAGKHPHVEEVRRARSKGRFDGSGGDPW